MFVILAEAESGIKVLGHGADVRRGGTMGVMRARDRHGGDFLEDEPRVHRLEATLYVTIAVLRKRARDDQIAGRAKAHQHRSAARISEAIVVGASFIPPEPVGGAKIHVVCLDANGVYRGAIGIKVQHLPRLSAK